MVLPDSRVKPVKTTSPRPLRFNRQWICIRDEHAIFIRLHRFIHRKRVIQIRTCRHRNFISLSILHHRRHPFLYHHKILPGRNILRNRLPDHLRLLQFRHTNHPKRQHNRHQPLRPPLHRPHHPFFSVYDREGNINACSSLKCTTE